MRSVSLFFVIMMCCIAAHLFAAPFEVVGAAGKPSVSTSTVRHDGSENARLFLKVLGDNLRRSGYFNVLDSTSASVMVSGQVTGSDGIAANVTVTLSSGRFTWSRRGAADETRDVAHALCDIIVKNVTGNPGMASAPLVFVGKRNGQTDIYSCDADGGRLRRLTQDGKTCLSPAWKIDRSGFFYTGFLKNAPFIYHVSFSRNGEMSRDVVSALPGLNSCPSPSPDGRSLALVLSVSGNVELYVMDLATRKLTRLTHTPHANEASPAWSPDSQSLAYVSDLSRAPQVYTIGRGERTGKRLVFNLAESVSPSWGSDGRIAFCGRPSGGAYGIYVMTPGGTPSQISPNTGDSYEEPSWAPDQRHIVATRVRGRARSLVILDTKGDSSVDLTPSGGEWYLANWARKNDKL